MNKPVVTVTTKTVRVTKLEKEPILIWVTLDGTITTS